MSARKAILPAAFLALAIACGGSAFTTGSATVSGTFGGQPMIAQDAISSLVTFGSGQTEALILITNATNQCNRINARQALRNGQALALTVGIQSGTTISPPTVGTYPVFTVNAGKSVSGPIAAASFATSDASCSASPSVEGTSGNVVLTAISPSGYTGTFDVTFTAPDHLTGSFTTAQCAPLANAMPPTSCGP
jgi:hypothetical protein